LELGLIPELGGTDIGAGTDTGAGAGAGTDTGAGAGAGAGAGPTGLGASNEFTNAIRDGYYYIAAQIAQNLGYNVQQTAEYINANAAALGLPENFAGVTGENLQPFFDGVNEKRIDAGMDVNYPTLMILILTRFKVL
jgi:hypothetical protein